MAMLFPCLAWLLVSLVGFYLFTHDRRRGLPPGPRPLPVIGSLHLLGDQPHRSLARLAKIHGPLMSLRLGTVTTVVASSPAVARELLQRNDAVISNRSVPAATGDHAENSIVWLPNAPRWRALRKTMAVELFARHRLDALQHLRREKVQELVDHIGRLALRGQAVNVSRAAFTTSMNLLSGTFFSRDLASLDDDDGRSREFQQVVTDMLEELGSPNISDFFPAFAAADLQGRRRRLARLFARQHRFFDEEIDGRLRGREAGESKKDDFLDLLLDAAEDDDNTARLDRNALRSLFTDLFSAGSDTSSSTIEWALVELLQNPSSMAKACNELAAVVGSRKQIEESDIDQLPYLQAVVKETFRLHPSVPMLPRHAQVDIKIMGYTIPKNSRVFVNVWAIGRDKETWPEPEKFVPERFLGKTVDLRGGEFDLIPFGGGRRICPGMPLAIRMVHLVLASLLNQFTWRLQIEVERNGVDMTEKFGLTLVKAVPLCAIATPI